LKQFQALAAANPDDIDARLWIARLHAWMGHPQRAADVYESIVATDPRNVDALIGLGDTLTTAGRLHEAADVLNRAESLAADRPAILAAQGRLHRAAGRSSLAVAYYRRALALDPANAEAREAFATLTAERAHRIEATYNFEHFNTAVPDTHAGAIELNARAGDAARVFGAAQHIRKFGRDEDRGGGGIEWIGRRVARVRAGALFGGDTLVLPDADVSIDAQYRRRRVAWLGAIRYLHFSASSSFVWSPGATVWLNDRVTATFRYYHSESDFDGSDVDGGNDGCAVEAAGRVSPHVWLNAGYARGFEALPLITSERLSQFDADNVSLGVRFDAGSRTSVAAAYGHQWRAADTRVATAAINFIQRF
jgi:YaiO family outer membrane protein